jgi:hypothetical protein
MAKEKNGECLSYEYIDSHTPLLWKCQHGHEWLAKPNTIRNGHWCARCHLTTEEKCRVIIEQLTGLNFVKNRKVIKPYELDGYSEELHAAYEYQGIQHYKYIEFFHRNPKALNDRIKDDIKKEQMCREQGIKLISIPYTAALSDTDLIEYITGQLRSFKIPVGDSSTIDLSLYYAGLDALAKLRELANEKGGECLATSYINNKTKVPWRCTYGHQWCAKPNDITSGQWCPVCARNQPLCLDDMHEIANGRNGRCLSLEYINNRTKLEWLCSQGHRWWASPDAIKRGTWCPSCATKRRANARKLTIGKMKEIAKEREGECLSEVYINSQTPLEWKCKRQHIWNARPNNIMNGTWCPKCKNRKI